LSTGRRILKNFLSLSFAQIVTKALGLIVVAYLARVLGAEGFGKIGFAQAILAYFMLLANLGLSTFGTREVARNREEINRYVNNILTIRLIASIGAFALLAVFVYFIPKPAEIKKLILLFGLTIFTFAFTIDWVFQGIERMEFIAISQIARQLVYVGLIFGIIRSPQQLLKVPLIRVGTTVVGVVILFSIFVKKFSVVRPKFAFAFWKQILKQSLPMGFSAIMISIYYNFDRVMLGFMKGDEVVGWYNAAYNVILVIITLPSLIIHSFFPSLSQAYRDNKKMSNITHRYLKIMFSIGIPFGFGGIVLASLIINLVYGQAYNNAILPFQILSWNIVAVFISIAFAHPLLAWNKQNTYMKIIAGGAITNLLFNFLLIPKFGIEGASIATVLAEVAVFSVAYFEIRKIVSVKVLGYLTKPLFASALMFGIVSILKAYFLGNLFLLMPLAICSYFLFLFLFKGFSLNDIKLAMSKIKS